MTINVNRVKLIDKLKATVKDLLAEDVKYNQAKEKYDAAAEEAAEKYLASGKYTLQVDTSYITNGKASARFYFPFKETAALRKPKGYSSENKIKSIQKNIMKLELSDETTVKVTDRDDYFQYV